MKLFCTIALAFLFAALSTAPGISQTVPVSVVDVHSKATLSLTAQYPGRSAKTSAETCPMDTFFNDSTYINRAFFLCGAGLILYTLQPSGYATGTRAVQPAFGTQPAVIATKYGLFFQYDIDDQTEVRVTDILFPPIADSVAILAKTVGEPDTMKVYIYEGSRLTGPKRNQAGNQYLPPIDSASFTPEGLRNDFGLVLSPNCMLASDSFFIAFEVHRRGSDDTLAFFCSDVTLACGQAERRTWMNLIDTATYSLEGWLALYNQQIQTVVGGPVLQFDSDILFIPVITFASSVSRDRPAVRENGLGLWGFFPNPAVHEGTLRIELAQSSDVTVRLADATGRPVRSFNLGQYGAGNHDLKIDLNGLAAGTYFYTVQAGAGQLTSKLVVN